MPTLVATAGSATANTYLGDTEAEVLADERLQVSNWSGAAATDQARALISATRLIDDLSFKGSKTSSGQALKWPRTDVFDENGDEYDSTTIPVLIERATFETALWLLNQDAAATDPLAPTGLEGFNRAKVGPLEVEPNHTYSAGTLPTSVLRMLDGVLVSGSSRITVAEMLRS